MGAGVSLPTRIEATKYETRTDSAGLAVNINDDDAIWQIIQAMSSTEPGSPDTTSAPYYAIQGITEDGRTLFRGEVTRTSFSLSIEPPDNYSSDPTGTVWNLLEAAR